jgi:hypothetical protein
MEKIEFKNKVLSWLKENSIDITSKKVRVYEYRGLWEEIQKVNLLNKKSSRNQNYKNG